MDLRIAVLVVSGFAVAYISFLVYGIMKKSGGNPLMKEISLGIRQGAQAFMRREFITLLFFSVAVSVILVIFLTPSPWVGIAFFLGSVSSAISAFIGISVAARANVITAQAAVESWARALKTAISAGSVMGFSVVVQALVWITVLSYIFEDRAVWLGFAFGTALVALFLRVGGGIFTKSADIGADLVGKVEENIPEDDRRNPAVIADNVGDIVGDVAGMGADLFESYVSTVIAAMVLGKLAYGNEGMLLPLILGAAGLLVSIIGTALIRPRDFDGNYEKRVKKAHSSMNRSVYIGNILMAVSGYFIIYAYMGDAVKSVFPVLLIGMVCGFLTGKTTEYFTAEHKPVLRIAKASRSGPAITIIEGISAGMLSTVIPIGIIAASMVAAFHFEGLFGIAIAALGMLLNLGLLLAMDCYGPIVDNAAGIAQMAELGDDVRQKCEALDAVGNTTAALGKGFAIASAALASMAWMATYYEVAQIDVASLTNIEVLAGAFTGGMMVFLFCGLTMRSVGSGAFDVVDEVRRQFRETKGLIEGTVKPDYAKCVDLATKKALGSMLIPGAAMIVIPLIIGFAMGKDAVAGLLAGVLIVGFPVAVMMANAGGAWDNSKKHIEAQKDGKGSEAHKAAVTGDTVGDPFKDTSGPSLNILIKMVGKVAVIFAPFFLK